MSRYSLQHRIGAGGVAEVWQARCQTASGDRTYAVKRLLPEHRHDAGLRTRLIDEHTIGRRLKHPHIVEIFDLVQIDGADHLVMEYVDGVSAEKLILRGLNGHFVPLAVSGAIVLAVIEALQYVHQEGVLHRDVSAENVLVSANGHIKLADFGIALAVGRLSSTEPGVVLGKEGYLSDARLLGDDAMATDDLFALGVLLERLIAAADPRERAHVDYAPLRELRARLGERHVGSAALAEHAGVALLQRVPRAKPQEVSAFLLSAPPRRATRSAAAAQPLDGTTADDAASRTSPRQARAVVRRAR